MTNTRAELADERVGLVARAIEREAEECGFSIFSDDAESIARAILSALRGQGEGWQAIETAPRDGSHILLGDEIEQFVAEAYWETDPNHPQWTRANEHWTDAHDSSLEMTHWQPLPAPPSQTGGDDGR